MKKVTYLFILFLGIASTGCQEEKGFLFQDVTRISFSPKEAGNYEIHPGGFTTLYAHCKCITASAGQTVRCGAILAQVGQTGAATGPHLHFELHWDQVYINPVYYVVS